MAVSHAKCTHPRTPAGRRACRSGSTEGSAPTPSQSWNARLGRVEREYAEAAGLVPNRRRQRSSEAVRIMPRRGGARVRANASTCVQAALHIAVHGGKCACGWSA